MDMFLVIDEMYYPPSTDTSPTFSCNDTFTALQTAISAGISYFATPVVLTPMTSNYPLLVRHSYVDVTPVVVVRTFQIVCPLSEAINSCSMKPGYPLMCQLEVAFPR